MITILKEITDWEFSGGTYYLNDHEQLVGYMPEDGAYKEFKNPIKQFSKARRKFKVLGHIEEDHDITQNTWEFTGSKGNKYIVTEVDGELACNCPGFRFRGNCKHVNEVIGI